MDSYIENLKKDSSVNRLQDENGNLYGIRVLGRGENLFFQENDKALICQINAFHSVIFTKTIKNWEGEKKMAHEEKNRVVNLIEKYYKLVYNPEVKLLDVNP
jgi:hypothetical protein